MHGHSGNKDLLINAALAARRARDHELENGLHDPSMVELFKTVLDHAFLLPLMELKLNQSTSFQGGQILAQQNLAQPFCFSSLTPQFFGRTFIALELTQIGENEFRHAFQELPYGRHLAYFEASLSEYSCVDFGTGICGTQSFIEHAMLSSDQHLIERIVDAETGESYFTRPEIGKVTIDLSFAKGSSPQPATRGAVVDLKNKRTL
jgi:hypothetical protein